MSEWEKSNEKFLIKIGQIKPAVEKLKADPKPKPIAKETIEE